MGRRVGISGVGAVVVVLPGLFLGVDVSPLLEGSGNAPGGPVDVTAQDRAAG
jgi:hypothetical protein